VQLNSGENNDLKKIRAFERVMIETSKNNEEVFEFENEQYNVYTDGVFVQTLIKGRILYRIYSDEEKNDDLVRYELMDHLQCINVASY
jgi:hypothetical protein